LLNSVVWLVTWDVGVANGLTTAPMDRSIAVFKNARLLKSILPAENFAQGIKTNLEYLF
jgi:hypothetical protein